MSIERARTLRKTMPAPEARMWNALRALKPLGFHFRRQAPLGAYYADFACHHAKLIIEIDGDTHGSEVAIAHDTTRDAFIRNEGYTVMRFGNADVMKNLDGVMIAVMVALEDKTKT